MRELPSHNAVNQTIGKDFLMATSSGEDASNAIPEIFPIFKWWIILGLPGHGITCPHATDVPKAISFPH